jgi:thiol-disulfide isomerase/thioredoxin
VRVPGDRRRHGLRLFSIVAGLSLVLGLGACSTGQTRSGGDTGYVAGDGSTVIIPAPDRQPAPPLQGLRTVQGDAFDPASVRGQVIALNVWASWCAPCRSEAAALQVVHEELQDQGFLVLGVNTRDSDDAARAFMRRFAVTYPSVVDRDGSALLLGFNRVVPRLYTPTTVVIDREGRVAAWALGEVNESRLRALIEPVLAERA